jgi:NADH-quinone oxidoreductase subunit N
MLSGVVVGTQLGIEATVLYLIVYLFMNIAAFAVIVAQQEERADGDQMSGITGLGARNPWLAWSMTIAMLSLAGIPGTVGFIGKFQLIHALVDGNYTWLAVVLVIGSMISLGYYLRVVAAIWMSAPTPAPVPATTSAPGGLAPIAGGSPEADELADGGGAGNGMSGGDGEAGDGLSATGDGTSARPSPFEPVTFIAVLFAAASVFFGIFPTPLFKLAAHAGRAITGL